MIKKNFYYTPSALRILNKHELKDAALITDTRAFTGHEAFAVIKGAKFNPMSAVEGLIIKGCHLVIYERDVENSSKAEELSQKFPDVTFIEVQDIVTYLQEISHLHADWWKKENPRNILFAISGSNGKTTHKEMFSHVLQIILPNEFVATEKNNNNHLGVPLTLLNINAKTKIVVLELGSNHPGEIKVLCDIAKPNSGITTNIGATHLEFFGDEQAVFEEEGYLYYSVKDTTNGNGFFLINNDDKYLRNFNNTQNSKRFSINPGCDYHYSFEDQSVMVKSNELTVKIQNCFITGNHNFLNLADVVVTCLNFFPEKKSEIIKAAESFQPTKNRSQWLQKDNLEIFLDAYNANPSSMKVAISEFINTLNRKDISLDKAKLIIADMNELGDKGPEYHTEVGKYLHDLRVVNVAFIGRYAKDYTKGFGHNADVYASAQEYKDKQFTIDKEKFRYFFLKGSRSLQLESILDIK